MDNISIYDYKAHIEYVKMKTGRKKLGACIGHSIGVTHNFILSLFDPEYFKDSF